MKKIHKHFIARLLVGAFIIFGIGFWISNFVVKAETWTLDGGLVTWNNTTNFLNSGFWNDSPSEFDIVTALYGAGDDGSIYTTGWDGYTSGSCLDAGMTVEYTGIIPTTIAANTIYVITSGIYTLTTGISMAECSALISSGTVILSGNIGNTGLISAIEQNNIIIEKIRTTNNVDGYGIYIKSGTNFSMNDIKTYDNSNGIYINNSLYGTVKNIEAYNNSHNGLYLYNSIYIFIDTITARDGSNIGVYLFSSSGNTLSGITSYDNVGVGTYFRSSNDNTLQNSLIYDNGGNGVHLDQSSTNTLDTIDSHDNDGHNISLDTAYGNILTNITADTSTVSMGIYLSNSSGNVLSGITTDGNYYAGIHFYNSDYNTGINIISNSNEGGLYMENSSGNNFDNITINNSSKNGLAFFDANNNTLSGLVSSGNMRLGMYGQYSNNNTISNSSIYQNLSGGIFSTSGNNNTFENSEIYNNTGVGIELANSSGVILDNLNIHDMLNFGNGITITNCTYGFITNTALVNNRLGIYFLYGHSNIISGTIITGTDIIGGIFLETTSNNTVYNINVFSTGSQEMYGSIGVRGGTGNTFALFSGNSQIIGYMQSGYNNTDIDFPEIVFDTYTQDNNYIDFIFSPYATLTGSVDSGTIFTSYTDTISSIIQNNIGYDDELFISGTNIRTISGADWDGKLYAPLQITTGAKEANLGETGILFVSNILDTIEVGTTGDTYLIVSGGETNINYYVLSGTDGQYVRILKSTDGETRTMNDSQSGCTLDSDLLCTFTNTDNLKLFAFGIPGFSFTGTTQLSANVTSGGYYNTGVQIYFTGDNISGAILNGDEYTSGTLITGDGTYVFVVSNIRDYSTGMTFTIDTVQPTISGVTSGAYYNTGKTITGYDAIAFSGFMLSGTFYTGASLTVTGEGIRTITGYDKAGNTSTGITFTIDTTYATFTGITQESTLVTSGGHYNTTGITITFTDTYLSGARLSGLNGNAYYNTGFLSGTTITTGGTYLLNIYDIAGNATGMVFTIDTTNPIVTGAYSPSSGSTVTGNSAITFTWSGIETNISGYNLYVYLSGGTTLYATGMTTGATSYTTTIGNNSGYTRYVLATDKAGNTGGSSIIPFSVDVPLSGVIALSGVGIQLSGSSKYVSSTFPIYLYANSTVNYTITGDITTILTGVLTGLTSFTVNPTATGTDGLKSIYVTLSTGNEYLYKTLTGYLDITKPTDPVLSTPTSGSVTTGAMTLTWSAATDSGVGLSGYRWYVSSTGTFATITASGFTTSISTTLAAGSIGVTGTFYWKVVSLDKLLWTGQSSGRNFYYSGEIFTPTSFSFTSITSARRDRIYRSSTGTIAGLSNGTYTLASISRGALYINGVMTGSNGYVKNGDTINIELNSSDEYDTIVNSILTIDNFSTIFRVTTMEEDDDIYDYDDIDTDLSNTEKLQIIAIFETLRDIYDGTKAEEFLNTLMVMLDNNIDDLDTNDTEYDALKYLYDLVKQYYDGQDFGDGLGSAPWIVNGVYTAPNGKRYTITYDSAKRQFTSTNFITPKYFPTLDVLKYTIDINNRAGSQYSNAKTIQARWGRISIDGTRQTSPYTAPNRKVYYFFKTIDGQYSSYTFTTEKYFNSLEEAKEYVYNSNR